MVIRVFNWLVGRLAQSGPRAWSSRAVVIAALLSPMLFITSFSYHEMRAHLTEMALEQREATAKLGATVVKERLDRLLDLGKSLASRRQFRLLVSEGRWDQAIRILDSIPEDFSYVERIFLTDLQGTETADTPALADVVGKSFAHRDWYRGVSRSWQPYLSGVYQRAAEPRHNVIAAAVPIRSEEGQILGILVIQTQVDNVLEWVAQITVGPAGFMYVTDQHGQVVAHPHLAVDGEIMDFSSVPTVQRALRGEQGVRVGINPVEHEDRVAAYAPVAAHGWAVVVAQPVGEAFAPRDVALRNLAVIYGIFLLLAWLFASALVGFAVQRTRGEQRIQQLNRELSRHTGQLEAANKELEAFSYSVSHDLRAPLRAIDGFSTVLAEEYAGVLDAEGKRLVGVVRTNAQRMGALIDDLLAFARLGRQELKQGPLDMTHLAHEVLTDLQVNGEVRTPAVHIDALPTAQGDRAMLRQVLANLLSNALKYTRKSETAHIEVGGRVEAREHLYYVKDNGVGFDMLYHHKLFGVFQRLHAEDEFEGTGVGLALVQRIIHRHGGRVWAEGKVDEGATFYFTLPNLEGGIDGGSEGSERRGDSAG